MKRSAMIMKMRSFEEVVQRVAVVGLTQKLLHL